MPLFSHDYLYSVSFHILQAAGTPEEEANIVSERLVAANLAGHDSHGILQLPIYIDRIKRGHIRPGAPIEILDETPTTARIDGNWGFGFVVSTRATKLAIEKAKAHNVAAVTVFHQGHVGRLCDYCVMAAREGFIAFMTSDSGRASKLVAPFGGRARRLGTNPLCLAIPSDLEGPIFIDMATSSAAGNKLLLARRRGEQIPPGWIVDKDGNPTTDPNAFYEGGAILPLGSPLLGYKGYGLSFMVEMFSGILTGLGFGHDPTGPHNDGNFIALWKVDSFRPLAEFKREIGEFVRYIKSSPPAAGFQEVLYPGEIEWRTEQKRRREGIFVEEETWKAIEGLIRDYGLESLIGQP